MWFLLRNLKLWSSLSEKFKCISELIRSFNFYFQWIQARTTESSDDLPSTRTIFPTKITSPTTTTTTTATPSGQKRTRNSTKLAEFQQKDFKPEIEVEPLSPSGQSETEKGETFRKASFFPDINKNNNAVTIKCSSHNNIVLLLIAVWAPKTIFSVS